MDALKQLQTSIAGTFEKCFDDTYKKLNAELAAYDARVNDAEARAEAADEARREMRSETEALRNELSLMRGKKRESNIDSTDNGPTTESLELDEIFEPSCVLGDVNGSNLSAERFKTISDRYLELYEQAGMFLEASVALRRQVKCHKRKLERLQSFFARQEFTLTFGDQVIKFHRVEQKPAQVTTLLEVTNPNADTETPTQNPVLPGASDGGSITGYEQENGGERQIQTGDSRQDPAHSDTSTVELPPVPLAARGTQTSGTLKRRHSGEQPALKHGSLGSANKGGLGHPIIVKSETMSSSPVMTYPSHTSHTGPTGTQDLDDIGDTVVTPTKRIRCREEPSFQSLRAESQPTMKTSSAPFLTQQNRMNGRNGSGVLQPVDSNLRNPSGLYQTPNKGRKREPGSIMRLSALTEDGDENLPLAFVRKPGTSTPENSLYSQIRSNSNRLTNLLDQPSPSSRSLLPKPAADKSTRKRTRSPKKGSFAANRSESGTTSTTPPVSSEYSQPNSKPSVRQPRSVSPTEISPEDEPYRARPLNRLTLDHFKINPNHNQGLDFAYDEVVRKRDERKCMGGCTRPGCCGDKFRAMARFGISTVASGRQISDEDILEEFLGEGEHTIDDFSTEQRRDLLEQAKAKFFSDRFGRHRHQHHRSGTPPGFWRTDMPGTQELEEDREQAHRFEREKVVERYRESMRSCGRWMFADE
ncbi:DNA repair protein endonuclease SAE2/CtIP C-terminus-domain-containing protein [Aspergillus carlsbadensis]|nr:DNA repair protein endonuclease SAE2/CtIP C-terminus-domain-containing protein [Aspergillus carlsbadensis]